MLSEGVGKMQIRFLPFDKLLRFLGKIASFMAVIDLEKTYCKVNGKELW